MVELLELTSTDAKSFLSSNFSNLFAYTMTHIKDMLVSKTIKDFIIKKIFFVENADYLTPLKDFTKNKNVKIFTTNYDLVIEKFCNNLLH